MPRFCTCKAILDRRTWASETNFVMNHTPGAGWIAKPVDQQSRLLPMGYDCPLQSMYDIYMITCSNKYKTIQQKSSIIARYRHCNFALLPAIHQTLLLCYDIALWGESIRAQDLLLSVLITPLGELFLLWFCLLYCGRYELQKRTNSP